MINSKKVKDITGQKFGRLTALEFVQTEDRHAVWRFKCDCGNEKVVVAANVRRGRTQSCGCIAKEYQWVVAERAKASKSD